MDKNKTKETLTKQLTGQTTTIGKETLGSGRIHVLGQPVCANPSQEKQIMRKIGMGWRVFGKHGDIIKITLPCSLYEK